MNKIFKTGFASFACFLMLSAFAVSTVSAEEAKTPTADEAALLKAADKGDLAAVKELVSKGADVNAIDERKYKTPLSEAAGGGKGPKYLEVVKFLVSKGADINPTMVYPPLDGAIGRGNSEVAKFLIAKGADVNGTSTTGVTPLMEAAPMGNVEIVKLLIAKGADVNAKRKDGATALMRAAMSSGSLKAAEILIANGADVNAMAKATTGVNKIVEGRGKTALFYASKDNRTELVKLLLANGADVHINTKDIRGDTPLSIASRNRYGCDVELVKALVASGADVNVENDGGTSPLAFMTVRSRVKYYLPAIEYLIANGADTNIKDQRGKPIVIPAKVKESLGL